MKITAPLLVFVFLSNYPLLFGKEVPYTLEDRDRLIRVETKIEEIDKRFEQIDKRFEQIDKRFEQIDKRFDQLFTFLWIITGIFTALTISTIGFAIWDRRSMIRPFEEKVKELEEKKIGKVIAVLQELARGDVRLAEALKKFNLL